jgi:large subunit ribosomal protein L15
MHDFDLHAPAGANRKKRIVGRGQGSGRGTTSGKGNKGQNARSGGKTYIGFEGGQMPLYRRLAQRGFSNHPFKREWQVVNLGEIDGRYEESETVDADSLFARGLIKKNSGPKARPVKILAEGDVTKKLVFKVGSVSAAAREKIEKSGGDLTVTPPPDKARPKGVKKGDRGKVNG